MGVFDRVRRAMSSRPVPTIPAGASVPSVAPQAAYFQGGRNTLLKSWRPALRESHEDIGDSWEDAAARAVDGVQNSGFLTRIVEVETGSVVGSGLRFSSRPDADALGWTEEYATKWARTFERAFGYYCNRPWEIDAGGRLTLAKMQQAIYASYKTHGEVLALTPVIKRKGSMYRSKVLLLPPSRLAQETNSFENIVQGVQLDAWSAPMAYRIKRRSPILGMETVTIPAFDRDGRSNVLHIFDAAVSAVRGISPMAPILKVVRQVDQYADATLTSALIQTIFAATIKTNMGGVGAFDGMMTEQDTANGLKTPSQFTIDSFAATQKEWYEAAEIDLTQHGRIAHLFPGDELDFTEAKQPGQQYDHFMGWLMREIAAGNGVTYESATGDYRGATYSSIRMGGAQEWLTVQRRRQNIVVPFCEAVKENWLDEAIYTGTLDYPGGYQRYLLQKDAAGRCSWSGPAQPQADDFKAARAQQVLKDIQATTLAEISSAYGRDWEDDMRQRKRENDSARQNGLPLPWAPKDIKETDKGLEAEIDATSAPAAAPGAGADEPADPEAVINEELETD